MEDTKEKVVVKYKNNTQTIKNLFESMKRDTQVLNQMFKLMGMTRVCETTIEACNVLLNQQRITKADIKELKRLNENLKNDCSEEIKRLYSD